MIPDYILPLGNHLWQSTLLAIAVWGITLALRKNRAAVRHRLWLAASLKFLVPFSLLYGIGSHFQWQTASVTPPRPVSRIVGTLSEPFSAWGPTLVSSGSTVPSGSTPVPQGSRFPSVLIGVWFCGVAASLFWWFIRWRQIRRAVRLATPAHFSGPLRVMYGTERFEPGVFGIFRPVLLLPEGIAHRLSPAQLQAVLDHELCHVRRRDNLAMASHMFVEALFWFHPLVWFIKLRLIEEQERACDEDVLRRGSEPMIYAESLLKVCEFYVESPLTCVSGVTGSDLKKRVARIMRNQIGETLKPWTKLILVTAGIAAMATPIAVGLVNASPIRPQTSQTQIRPEASQTQIRPEAPQTPIRPETPQNTIRPADTPKWEVVSIRPCPTDTPPDFVPGPRGGGGGPPPGPPFRFSADRMTLNCRPVRFLIRSAYQTYLDPGAPGSSPKDDVLVGLGTRKTPTDGPAWIDSERYTIEAKAERVTDRAMMQGPMLKTILEDRFKLKVHWEPREIELYALVVAKGGPKLKPFQEGSCIPFPAGFFFTIAFGGAPPDRPAGQRYCSVGGGLGPTGTEGYGGDGITIDEFVKLFLSGGPRFVIDKTGLTGKYDIHVEYRAELDDAVRQRFAEATGEELPVSTAPTLFDALQEQLGLKLESTKGPVEFQVIDHIEHPSPN